MDKNVADSSGDRSAGQAGREPGREPGRGLAAPGAGGGAAAAAGGAGAYLGAAQDRLQQAFMGWNGLAPRQRFWAAVGTVMLVATIVGLAWYGTRTDWKTLYAGLDPEDSRQMAQVLTQAQITYDVAGNGTTIRVPAGQLDKARLATAAKGGPRSGRMGFELFDKPNWVGSEFDEQVNYQRALEGELEHTVATLSDIQSARVHLVMPHESLFRDQERPAKAAVVLTLRHRGLAEGEDEAIRNLVASAVDGLSASRVSLVDAGGRLQLGPKTAEAERLSAEQALEAKLIETLEPVTGAGNVRASVTLDYDRASSEVTEETYDPEEAATLTMQRTEQGVGPQPVASGVPGTASNAPGSPPLPVYPQQNGPSQTAKSESSTYGVSRKVRHLVEGSGRMRRLTAAVVVNDRMTAVAQKGKPPTWAPRGAEELRTLTALAQAAVGYDLGRGDLVTVQDLAFDENRNTPVLSPVKQALDQSLGMVEHSPLLLKYGTLLTGLLLLIVLAIRPALGRAAAAMSAGGGGRGRAAELSSPGAQAGLRAGGPGAHAALDVERQRAQQVFEQVTDQLKRDPTQTSRLLQGWIHSE